MRTVMLWVRQNPRSFGIVLAGLVGSLFAISYFNKARANQTKTNAVEDVDYSLYAG